MPGSPTGPSRTTDWGEFTEFARELPTRLAAAYAQEGERSRNLRADQHEGPSDE